MRVLKDAAGKQVSIISTHHECRTSQLQKEAFQSILLCEQVVFHLAPAASGFERRERLKFGLDADQFPAAHEAVFEADGRKPASPDNDDLVNHWAGFEKFRRHALTEPVDRSFHSDYAAVGPNDGTLLEACILARTRSAVHG